MRYVKRVLINGLALRRSVRYFLVLFCLASAVQAGENGAIVQGASGANLRSGPGLSYPAVNVLSENAPVIIQGRSSEWYLVTTVEGQKGYVHQSLIRVVGEPLPPTARNDEISSTGAETPMPVQSTPARTAPAPPRAAAKADTEPAPAGREVTVSAPPAATSRAPAAAEANNLKTDRPNSPPLIDLLEGREADLVLWVTIAVVFFLIGWICGGNYYLRRDRLRRTKLRF
jgi:hypothetical protein